MGDHHRSIQALGEHGLVESAKVAPGDEGGSSLLGGPPVDGWVLEDSRRFVVGHPVEGLHHLLQRGGVPLQHLEIFAISFQDPPYQVNDQIFGKL